MFTGIVEELGVVRSLDDRRLVVDCRAVTADSSIGSSVAVNGVCLTVVERDGRPAGVRPVRGDGRTNGLRRLAPWAHP